jgi:hypothetical protein
MRAFSCAVGRYGITSEFNDSTSCAATAVTKRRALREEVMRTPLWTLALALLFAPTALSQTNEELIGGATNTGNVVNYGMGYNLQRFSPLDQINKSTVKRLD